MRTIFLVTFVHFLLRSVFAFVVQPPKTTGTHRPSSVLLATRIKEWKVLPSGQLKGRVGDFMITTSRLQQPELAEPGVTVSTASGSQYLLSGGALPGSKVYSAPRPAPVVAAKGVTPQPSTAPKAASTPEPVSEFVPTPPKFASALSKMNKSGDSSRGGMVLFASLASIGLLAATFIVFAVGVNLSNGLDTNEILLSVYVYGVTLALVQLFVDAVQLENN